MYDKLAIFAACLGVVNVIAVLFTIWTIMQKRKHSTADATRFSQQMGAHFMRWTVFDYAALALFACGMLFLFVDALGVIRDRHDYPYWHYGYLLCGFVFSFLGMLFTLIRLAIVLHVTRTHSFSAINDHHKPNETDAAKHRI